MENKSTLTYSFSNSGDEELFLNLSTRLGEALSNQTVEWKRTYGRASHKFQLKVKILPLTSALLDRSDLITRPYFHIFWTDCNDIDQYRGTIRDEISSWLNLLKNQQDVEWMIVVVASDILSRLTKSKISLPRTSISDKIKADFCSKSSERLHILHDPSKESTKSTESWALLGSKVANMTVRCMDTVVSKYEDQVRTERERRNEKSWDFCSYLVLQEELAFMYEMLGMFSPALVQYDELDAMFTQYILNANAGDVAHWLSHFSKPITQWHSLLLWKTIDGEARKAILDGSASIIDIRNYLFTRLCRLLFEMGKVMEITQRMHFFLHSVATEIAILEISVPPGAIDCWVFMCCLELVGALKRKVTPDTSTADSVKQHWDMTREQLVLENASLWNMARIKLYSLGKLCGLLPGCTDEKLQTVVDLLAGMGEAEERGDIATSPSLVLREALSSKINFQKQYFELSELAMGTYKHMGHYRSVRSIGNDLAQFYLLAGEPHNAESYLVDTVRMFTDDKWDLLNTRATINLATCYKKMIDIRKYLKLCNKLMCDKLLTREEKLFYCNEFKSLSTDLGDGHLALHIQPLATAVSIQFIPVQTSFRLNSQQRMILTIKSNAPDPITFEEIQISLEHLDQEDDINNVPDTTSMSSFLSKTSGESEIDTKSAEPNVSYNSSYGYKASHKRLPSTTSSREFMTSQEAKMDDSGLIQIMTLNYGEGHALRTALSSHLNGITAHRKILSDGTVAVAGVYCRRAHEVLRRQDSSQSHQPNQDGDGPVAMETYDCCLATKQVTLRPGVNQVKFALKTDLEGSFTLQQLRLRLHQSYFVLPRVYPIVTYHVTFVQPRLGVDHEELITGIVQLLRVSINLGDHVLTNHEPLDLTFKTTSEVRLLAVTKCSLVTPDGDVTTVESPPLLPHSDGVCARLPSSGLYITTVLTVACVCQTPETVQNADANRRHRRTHSAPPETFSRSPKAAPRHIPIVEPPSEHSSSEDDVTALSVEDGLTNGLVTEATNDEEPQDQKDQHHRPKEETIGSRLDDLKDSFYKRKNNFRKKFIKSKTPNPVKSGKPRFEDWPRVPTSEPDVISTPSLRLNGDLIEVTLNDDADDVDTAVTSRSASPISTHAAKDVTSMRSYIFTSSDDDDEDMMTQKQLKPVSNRHGPSRSEVGLHRNFDPPTISPPQNKNNSRNDVTYDITLGAPWSDDVTVTSCIVCKRPLEFSNSLSFIGSGENPKRLLTVNVENLTSSALTLVNPRVTMSNVEDLTSLNLKSTVIKAHGSASFAWKFNNSGFKARTSSANLQLDLISTCDDVDYDVTSGVTYKFTVENVRPIYTISCTTADDESIYAGAMTSLRIDVMRLRHDPGHETTSNGQQLLMFQAMDTRARWAICGKSTGILSMPGPKVSGETPSNETHLCTATLDVMPLVSGSLHLPFVLIHRYIKRRSSEFDERLSSTESPVLKPPRLIDFHKGEILHYDQATQVDVLPAEELARITRGTAL